MRIPFHKYEATGNDFVIIDNRTGTLTLSNDAIRRICDRRFGVGADGVLLIEKHPTDDFNLIYYNPDGSQSLCANGSRAALLMASNLGMINGKGRFHAYDGVHEAELTKNSIIRMRMNDVPSVRNMNDDYFINTGSPHFIRFVRDVDAHPVVAEGRRIRYSEPFREKGVNANFVELLTGNRIAVRTYERGVEDETYSCGTGITAAALAASFRGCTSPTEVKARGGDLRVEFERELAGDTVSFRNVFLSGPARKVFEGQLDL